MDFEREIAELALANAHVEQARENIRKLTERLERRHVNDYATQQTEATLAVLRAALVGMIEHRDFIAR